MPGIVAAGRGAVTLLGEITRHLRQPRPPRPMRSRAGGRVVVALRPRPCHLLTKQSSHSYSMIHQIVLLSATTTKMLLMKSF